MNHKQNIFNEGGIKAAMVFVGVAVLVHAAVYYGASRQDSDKWIYSSVQGVQTRTDRQTGVMYFSGPRGWMTTEQRQADLEEQRRKIQGMGLGR
jgi:hypothetical protein